MILSRFSLDFDFKGFTIGFTYYLGWMEIPPWERYDFVLGLGKREGKSEGYSREFEGNRTQCDIEQSGSMLRKVFSHFFRTPI